jgi:nucleotide-binding universal stress UspA family protein
MKILATFDGSQFSESILPQLETLCILPGTEIVLVSVAEMPHGQLRDDASRATAKPMVAPGVTLTIVEPSPAEYAETKGQAVERRRAELNDYLNRIASRLPQGATHRVSILFADDAAEAIIQLAAAEKPDMIVTATHGHTGLSQLLFGHVAEQVVRSGVAPVLLVHPDGIKRAREAVGPA